MQPWPPTQGPSESSREAAFPPLVCGHDFSLALRPQGHLQTPPDGRTTAGCGEERRRRRVPCPGWERARPEAEPPAPRGSRSKSGLPRRCGRSERRPPAGLVLPTWHLPSGPGPGARGAREACKPGRESKPARSGRSPQPAGRALCAGGCGRDLAGASLQAGRRRSPGAWELFAIP